jgi:hypothetical protein
MNAAGQRKLQAHLRRTHQRVGPMVRMEASSYGRPRLSMASVRLPALYSEA